jgi:hypothetical protein
MPVLGAAIVYCVHFRDAKNKKSARHQKVMFGDNQPMHLMVEHASLGATPVKPKAAEGSGLKGQALRAQRRARQLEA